MISIIICSRTQVLSNELTENIKNTVGCDYELVVIDNSENRYSIFQAYNVGIDKSIGDYLCFIHDDILFHTEGWGTMVESVFNYNIKIGLIGIAGAKIKTKMPSAWWNCEERYIKMRLKQHFNTGEIRDWSIGNQLQDIEEVVAIDGVFMAARKDKRIRFNKKLIGFHNYDLNLSFEYIQKGYKIMVTNLIFIEHFSLGKIDKSWYDSTLKIHSLYSKLLPLSVAETNDFSKQEFTNGHQFLIGMLDHKLKAASFLLWLKLILVKPCCRFHFQFLKKVIQ